MLWDLATGGELQNLDGHLRRVTALAFPPGSKMPVSVLHNQTTKLWNLARGGELQTLDDQSGMVAAVVYSPDSQIPVLTSHDQTIKFWNPTKEKSYRS
jgi:WD40 repeat protein